MDLIQGLALITSIHLLAAASPGPDFVLVSQQTLLHGKKAGLLASIGIALGLSVHILYSSLGLAAVIANSQTALWLIKMIGGCYLIYLGLKGLKSKRKQAVSIENSPEKSGGAMKSISTGFLCNALNPKAPVYFVALFTLVLSPEMPLWQLAIYGCWMMFLQLFWFSMVVLLLSQPVVNLKFQSFGHIIDKFLGGAMIFMGLKLLISKV